MPENVKIGKSTKNNWYDYQSHFLTESDSENSNYRNWFLAINDGLTAEEKFYFINHCPKGSDRNVKSKIKKVVDDVFDKFDGELTDESRMRPSYGKRHPEFLECFKRNPFPPKEELLELSKSTGL